MEEQEEESSTLASEISRLEFLESPPAVHLEEVSLAAGGEFTAANSLCSQLTESLRFRKCLGCWRESCPGLAKLMDSFSKGCCGALRGALWGQPLHIGLAKEL